MHRNIFRTSSIQVIQKRFFKKDQVRVRFAPSPTGLLHLGGLRTALYNYLFARANNGAFILRIEDTDQVRCIPGAMEKLQNDLLWSGIISDEDPIRGGPSGPYIQSKRLDLYKEQVLKLLSNQSAYYCFCTESRLQLLRREALKCRQVPKYDNRCRHLSSDEIKEKLNKGHPYCIRFKLSSTPECFDDMIYGKIIHDISQSEGDPVIIKSDGYPTYHFANVVDDHFMEISHVLRGIEWQISTPKHLMMYKLQGIFPLAVINFVIHAGGGFSNKGGVEYIHSYEELIKRFNISDVKVTSNKLIPEKLLQFNKLEISKLLAYEKNNKFLVERIKELIINSFPERKADGSLQLDDYHILAVLKWAQNRIYKLSDLVSSDLAFLWIVPSTTPENIQSECLDVLKILNTKLVETDIHNFNKAWINSYLKEFANEHKIPFSTLMSVLRGILSGLKEGPPVGEMIEILGKDTTLLRMNRCIS
ncbi:putative glutamate--tRNA ligase, mitochondrial isoform X2 [Lasioglossum baleicum]|uniref:putative glutamate--tRNA ligase, mitochondrial isoform X2 n=1 Tax=Lasioglossum baleicum TaxID=434251 RepID=UPI003FCE7FDF